MADCDVAVVGAGVIGQAIAYELVIRGTSVTVVDARGPGLGSTQAAAGMLVPYIEGAAGHPLLPLAAKSLAMYDEFVERLTRDTNLDVGYARSGSLQVATNDEALGDLERVASGAKNAGVRCELLDADGTHRAEPHLTPEIKGGLLIHDHGFINALDLSGALSAGAFKHGARMVAPARVQRISARNGAMDVELEGGNQITARQVILAAGCWSGQIEISGISPLPIRPVRGQLLQLSWTAAPLKHIVWGPDCYIVPGLNSVLVGATVEEAGFDERTTVAGIRDLLDAASEIVPPIWQTSFSDARVGLRPTAPDAMPVIGRSRNVPGVIFATGHFRNGILLAPFTAKAVADLVLEYREDPLLAFTSPQRFGEY